MSEFWIPITDISSQGKKFLITDQHVWQDPIGEFDLQYRILKPIRAEVFILPGREDACHISGEIKGRIGVPCSRCADECPISLNNYFDMFEELGTSSEEADRLGPAVMYKEQGYLQLNIGALLWEQFLLAVPLKPLCSDHCAGICSVCGKNLNQGSCQCRNDFYDERMQVFRQLKIN